MFYFNRRLKIIDVGVFSRIIKIEDKMKRLYNETFHLTTEGEEIDKKISKFLHNLLKDYPDVCIRDFTSVIDGANNFNMLGGILNWREIKNGRKAPFK